MRLTMEIVKQLAVFLENQPGALFRLTQDLAERQINIEAISVTDSIDHAVVRLIVDKPIEAIHIIEEKGTLVVESDLVKVTLKNEAGTLNQMCKKLRTHQVNIEYAYGSTGEKDSNLYLRVMDVEKALKALTTN